MKRKTAISFVGIKDAKKRILPCSREEGAKYLWGKNDLIARSARSIIETAATEADIFIELDVIMRIAHKSTLTSCE